MAVLVRFVGTRTAWPPQFGADPARGVLDFALRPGEIGLSVWRVDSPVARDLVLAERACQRQRIDVMDFIEVDEAVVSAFGEITSAPIPTIVTSVGVHHCELRWSQESLTRLAEALLADGVTAQRVSRSELKQLLSVLDNAQVDEEHRPLLERLRG